MKWDQEGFEAMLHNMETARFLGGLGFFFATEFARSVPMLVRLYIAHISVLPLLLLVLLGAHLLLVKLHGISPSPWRPVGAAGSGETFAGHVRKLGGYSLILSGVLFILAVLLPAPLGPAPVEGIEVTKPPWVLLWLYPVENWLGLPGILYATLALFALLAAIPLLDRGTELAPGQRRLVIVTGGVALAVMVGLTVFAVWGPTVAHVGMAGM